MARSRKRAVSKPCLELGHTRLEEPEEPEVQGTAPQVARGSQAPRLEVDMKIRRAKPIERVSSTLTAVDLRLGRWQDVLDDVEVDAEISDPPYSARVHSFVVDERLDGASSAGLRPEYAAWTPREVHEYVSVRSPLVKGWMVSLTSHDLIPAWEEAHRAAGRLVFAPVACVIRGMSFRKQGDGPASWTVYAIVARPRAKRFMGGWACAGAYVVPSGSESGGGRGKPMWLMQALVRDYSRAGDLVCDPFAGHGTTLAAAVSLGRKAIGAEVDADAHAEALQRLDRPLQTDLFRAAIPQGGRT